jgi:hypothetical protein
MGFTRPLRGQMRSYSKEKWQFRSRKLGLTTVADPPCWPRDIPLSTKLGTKFRQQVTVVSRYTSLAD